MIGLSLFEFFLFFLCISHRFSSAKNVATILKQSSPIYLDSNQSPGNESALFLFLDDYFGGDDLVYSVNATVSYLHLEQRLSTGKQASFNGKSDLISVDSDSNLDGSLPEEKAFLDDQFNVLFASLKYSNEPAQNEGIQMQNDGIYSVDWWMSIQKTLSEGVSCFDVVYAKGISCLFVVCLDSKTKETIGIAISTETRQEISRVYSKSPQSYMRVDMSKMYGRFLYPDMLLIYTPQNTSVFWYRSHGYIQLWEVSKDGFLTPSANSSDQKEPKYFANCTTFNESSLDIAKLVVFQKTLYILDQYTGIFFEISVNVSDGFFVLAKTVLPENTDYISFDVVGNSYDWASKQREVSVFMATSLQVVYEYTWVSGKLLIPRKSYRQDWPVGSTLKNIKINGPCILLLFSLNESPWNLNSVQIIQRESTVYSYALASSFSKEPILPVFNEVDSSFILISAKTQQSFQVNDRSAILSLFPKQPPNLTKYLKVTASNSFSKIFQVFSVSFLNFSTLAQTGPLMIDDTQRILGRTFDSLEVDLIEENIWGPSISYSVYSNDFRYLSSEINVVSSNIKVLWNMNITFVRRDYISYTQVSKNIEGSLIKDKLLFFVNILEFRTFLVFGCSYGPLEDIWCRTRGALNGMIEKKIQKVVFSFDTIGIITQSQLIPNISDIKFFPIYLSRLEPFLVLRNISNCFFLDHPDFQTFACSFPLQGAIRFYGLNLTLVDEIKASSFGQDIGTFQPQKILFDYDSTPSILLIQNLNSILFINLQVFRAQRLVFVEHEVADLSDGFEWEFDGLKLLLILIWPKTGVIRQVLVSVGHEQTQTTHFSSMITQSKFNIRDISLGSIIENDYTKQFYSFSKQTNRLYLLTEQGVVAFDTGKPLGSSFYTQIAFERSYSPFSNLFVVPATPEKDLVVFNDLRNETFWDLFQAKTVDKKPKILLKATQPTNATVVLGLNDRTDYLDINLASEIVDSQLEISLNASRKPYVVANAEEKKVSIENSRPFEGLVLFYRPIAPDWGDIDVNFWVLNRVFVNSSSPLVSKAQSEFQIQSFVKGEQYTILLTTKSLVLLDPKTLQLLEVFDILVPIIPFASESYQCFLITIDPQNENLLSVYCEYSSKTYLVLIYVQKVCLESETETIYQPVVLSGYESKITKAVKMIFQSSEDYLLLFVLDHNEHQDMVWVFKVSSFLSEAFLVLNCIGKTSVSDPCDEFSLTDFQVFYNDFSTSFVLLLVDQANGIRIWIWQMFQTTFFFSNDLVQVYNPLAPEDYLFPSAVQIQNIQCDKMAGSFLDFQCLLTSKFGGHFDVSLKIVERVQHSISLTKQFMNYGNYQAVPGSFAVSDDFFAVLAYKKDFFQQTGDSSLLKSPKVILFYERKSQEQGVIKPFFGLNGNLLGPEDLSRGFSKYPMFFHTNTINKNEPKLYFCTASNSFMKLRIFELKNDSYFIIKASSMHFNSTKIQLLGINDFSQGALGIEVNPNEGKSYMLCLIFFISTVSIGVLSIFFEFLVCPNDKDVRNQMLSTRRKNEKRLSERLKKQEMEMKKGEMEGSTLSIFKGKGNEGMTRDDEGYIVKRLSVDE